MSWKVTIYLNEDFDRNVQFCSSRPHDYDVLP